MKKMKRILSIFLLALTMLSMIPLSAAADSKKTATVTVTVKASSKTLYTYKVTVGDKPVTLEDDTYIEHSDKYYKFSHYAISGKKAKSITIPAYDGTATWTKKWGKTISVVYASHKHKLYSGYGRVYHWKICDCGYTTNEVRHVDPATDDDKICTCGYKFNDNADLVTLWLDNMQLSPQFNKETTEYIGNVITWKDVTDTAITANPFDALATVTLPENLEIHEGANKFDITVTSENTLVTKTYTVVAIKPVRVETVDIGSDGKTLSAAFKAPVKGQDASAAIPEAAGSKMVEIAAADGCSRIVLKPDFSKWGTRQVEVTLPGSLLKAIAEGTTAELAVETTYGTTLTIPHSELAALAEGHEAVVVRVSKDNTFAIVIDGVETTPSQQMILTVPEA